jgi:hypothetical protein
MHETRYFGGFMDRMAATFWLVVMVLVGLVALFNRWRHDAGNEKLRKRAEVAWVTFWSHFALLFVVSVVYGVNLFAELDQS